MQYDSLPQSSVDEQVSALLFSVFPAEEQILATTQTCLKVLTTQRLDDAAAIHVGSALKVLRHKDMTCERCYWPKLFC